MLIHLPINRQLGVFVLPYKEKPDLGITPLEGVLSLRLYLGITPLEGVLSLRLIPMSHYFRNTIHQPLKSPTITLTDVTS